MKTFRVPSCFIPVESPVAVVSSFSRDDVIQVRSTFVFPVDSNVWLDRRKFLFRPHDISTTQHEKKLCRRWGTVTEGDLESMKTFSGLVFKWGS